MSNFGPSLKKARESKGISLDSIAVETRISTRFLLAIENEEFKLLPGGVFNRGFVRAYAEKVGLDPDQMVAEYERLAAVDEPAEASPSISSNRKGDRRLYTLAIGGLVLVIIIFYIFTRETFPNTAQTAITPAAPSAAAQPAAVPSPPLPSESLTPPTTAPEVTSAAPEPVAPPKAEALRIDLNITESTWVKVEADGMIVVAGEVLEPGTMRHFTAHNSVVLAVGNAAGMSLKINDMPVKNLGKNGQVRQLNITPENIKSFIG